MDQYQSYIFKSRYARYLPDQQRRETWDETVGRYIQFFRDREQLSPQMANKLFESIRDMEVMPSMRCMMTAGKALDRDNVAGYNCSYLPIDHPRSFDELMYVLMCGTGVGYSVERENVNKLPEVADEFHDTDTTIVVSDSKIGWASAFRELISLLYSGKVPKCDLTRIRPAGSRLRTFGGRASGPEPLADLFNFAVQLFRGAAGRQLTDLECHDLACKIADIVVVGGVRRSALISLSNVSSHRMQTAKSGQWWLTDGHRALANNSAVYLGKPDYGTFLNEMQSLYESKSGERGIFSRKAAKIVADRNGRRVTDGIDFGTNPCSEIILRPYQFCNLTEVVIRPEDTLASLKAKIRNATILGTLQSTLVDFRYLRKIWKTNTEEEALLGVSLTGIMDHPILGDPDNEELPKWLEALRDTAIETNRTWADKLGVNPSAAITCVKPSGTVSQLVDSSSGIHPRFADYYIRTVRADKKDPLARAMEEAGFPVETDVTNNSNAVFSFPIKAPDATKALSSLEQLKLWKVYQDHYCEHKPSMTCYYDDDSFLQVAQWVWENFDSISGISFLPKDDHVYAQAPYQKITKAEYKDWLKRVPASFDWDIPEDEDNTEAMQTLACVSGVCEL
jgi:ribonucleoside-diphosphate reductase alpha chain